MPEPWDVVEKLARWADATPWVETLEIGGSLGRGAGDRWSDVDAGVGLADGEDAQVRLGQVGAAIATIDVVAGRVREPMGDGCHLSTVFADGSELSLVIVTAASRAGLPPQTRSVVDKAGRLADVLDAARWDASGDTLRLWVHQAWTGCADAARHAARGESWRALESLQSARDRFWRLWGARNGVVFPQFGVVSVSNGGVVLPEGIAATHPAALTGAELVRAVRALMNVLRRELGESALADAIERRVAEVTADVG